MGEFAFRPHEPAEHLIPRLQRCLPDFFEVSEIHGLVYIEIDRLPCERVKAGVRAALERVYGPEWRAMVDGFDDED
jgi:hypothetical protein